MLKKLTCNKQTDRCIDEKWVESIKSFKHKNIILFFIPPSIKSTEYFLRIWNNSKAWPKCQELTVFSLYMLVLYWKINFFQVIKNVFFIHRWFHFSSIHFLFSFIISIMLSVAIHVVQYMIYVCIYKKFILQMVCLFILITSNELKKKWNILSVMLSFSYPAACKNNK